MWDLTIQTDHDFYIQAATATVLAHNCPYNWRARNAANRAAGNAARDAIADMYPGSTTEVRFDTELGTRIVDVLTPENIAIESKVGYTTVSRVTASQMAKDQLLIESGKVSGVKWIFSPNEYGDVGPSGPLGDALDSAGIPWEIMRP
jgi:hypothetical protein